MRVFFKRRISVLLLLAAALMPILSLLPYQTFAAGTINETLDLLNVRQNQSGEGYYWKNTTDTMTLTNFNLKTESRYGLRLPGGSTVVLEGNNYISASYAAFDCEGVLTFTGNGSLTIESGDIGILNYSSDQNAKITFFSGTYTIKAAKTGIKTNRGELSLTGGSFDITAGEYGIYCNNRLKMLNRTAVVSNAPLYASGDIIINNAALSIQASSSALVSGKNIKIDSVKINAGANSGSLSAVSAYNGENSIRLTTTRIQLARSVLYGRSHTIIADIITLIVVVILISAVIIIPKVVRKKKFEKFIAQRDAKRAAEASEKKEQEKAESAKKKYKK